MSLCSKSRFVLSANIIVFSKSAAFSRSLTHAESYLMLICLIGIINVNILFSIFEITSKLRKICTRNSIDRKLFQKYCNIGFVKGLWKIDKNTFKWFVSLIQKLDKCMFCRKIIFKTTLLWVKDFLIFTFSYEWDIRWFVRNMKVPEFVVMNQIRWSGKTRVASYELQVKSLKARVEIQKHEFKFKSTSYELKSTSREFESTSSRIIKSLNH